MEIESPMYGVKNSHGKFVLFSALVTLLLLASSLPVNAEWTENFKNDNLRDWDLTAHGNSIGLDEYTWFVQDGVLASGGAEGSEPSYDMACRSSDIELGHWYIDILTGGPSSVWSVTLGKTFPGQGNTFSQASFYLFKGPGQLAITYWFAVSATQNDFTFLLSKNLNNITITDGNWHTFLLTRTGDRTFEFSIDGEQIDIRDVPSDVPVPPNYDELCIASQHGGYHRFDNVGVSNLGNYPPSSSNLPIFIGLGVLVAVTIVAVFSKTGILKKKE